MEGALVHSQSASVTTIHLLLRILLLALCVSQAHAANGLTDTDNRHGDMASMRGNSSGNGFEGDARHPVIAVAGANLLPAQEYASLSISTERFDRVVEPGTVSLRPNHDGYALPVVFTALRENA